MTGVADETRLSQQELGQLRHSLRTPINQIVGYAELLLEEPQAPPALRSALETTLATVRHGLSLISIVIPATATPLVSAGVKNAAGSGSAALTPPALPGSDGAASAAAPVALAAARSTTTASSAALPDPSGTGTALVISCVGLMLCGAVAYALVLSSRRRPRAH